MNWLAVTIAVAALSVAGGFTEGRNAGMWSLGAFGWMGTAAILVALRKGNERGGRP